MVSNKFSPIEIDAIGEILNISLGASATAVSTMLSKRVDITTPSVQVVSMKDFDFEESFGFEEAKFESLVTYFLSDLFTVNKKDNNYSLLSSSITGSV